MRIAVVGAGISGLASAYVLSRVHDVELFERNAYFGGHSHTVTVGDEEPVHLDTGFVVYNEPAYPHFVRLLADLGVATQPSDMSFAVRCRACRLQYSSRGRAGMLSRPLSKLRPGRIRLGLDILRFYRDGPAACNDPNIAQLTVDEYVRQAGFGGEFRRHFLIPLAAAVWSTPPDETGAFPASYLLHFLCNHGLIGGQDPWRWRSIRGGSRSYVGRIIERLGERSLLAAPVEAVLRHPDAVELLVNGQCRSYDAVVMACHADETRALLADRSPEEDAALACFSYTRNRAVLHTDGTLLAKDPNARASWNYHTHDCRRPGAPLALTYHLNRLQSLAGPTDYLVSVNPSLPISPEKVIQEMQYDHPRYTFRTLEGQERLRSLKDSRRTYFAGAHLGHGFHEDGVRSAIEVAKALGVSYA